MTTKRIPLCSTKGCPHPSDPDWHKPWCQAIKGHRCFGGATHQHVPKKGMGGHNPESEIVACLCAGAHDKIDNGPWGNAVIDVPGVGKVYTIWDVRKKPPLLERIIEAAPESKKEEQDADRETSQGLQGKVGESGEAAPNGEDEALSQDARDYSGALHGVVGPTAAQSIRQGEPDLDAEGLGGIDPRKPAPAPEIDAIATLQIGATAEKPFVGLGAGDWATVPDEQLAALFAEADRRQAEGFLLKCRIVHTFRERHVQAWGSSWTESAYDLFHISRRTLNAYANLHEICDTSDRYLIEQIAPLTDSKGLMTHIGRKKVEDGKVALEAAVSYQAEFAEPPTVKALMHKLGEEAKPARDERCPNNPLVGGHHAYTCRWCGKEK